MDGCDSTCSIEEGYSCTQTLWLNDLVCYSCHSECDGCTASNDASACINCRIGALKTIDNNMRCYNTEECGDGIISEYEACDEGVLAPADERGCSNDC